MKLFRVQTIDAWVQIKPRLKEAIDALVKVSTDDQDASDMYAYVEDYLADNNDDIYVGVCIEQFEIVTYLVLVQVDNITCCISQVWCKKGTIWNILDHAYVLKEFAAGRKIYWDSIKDTDITILKDVKFKKKFVRYELEL